MVICTQDVTNTCSLLSFYCIMIFIFSVTLYIYIYIYLFIYTWNLYKTVNFCYFSHFINREFFLKIKGYRSLFVLIVKVFIQILKFNGTR